MDPKQNIPHKPEETSVPPMAPEPKIPNQPRTMENDSRPPTFDSEEPAFTPETNNQLIEPLSPAIGGSSGGLFKWFIVVVVLLVLGLVGYFVVYPMFVEKPTDPGTAQIPMDIKPHVSAFADMNIKKVVISLRENSNIGDLNLVFSQQGELASMGITEIVFNDKDGNRIDFASLLNIIIPGELDLANTASIFDVSTHFTSFLYKNEEGVWPGYIVRQTAGVTDNTVYDWLALLERSSLDSFFIGDTGEFSEFVDGDVLGLPDKYSPAGDGSSFSYMKVGDKVILGTSYDLMKKTVETLGLVNVQN